VFSGLVETSVACKQWLRFLLLKQLKLSNAAWQLLQPFKRHVLTGFAVSMNAERFAVPEPQTRSPAIKSEIRGLLGKLGLSPVV